MNLPRLKSQDSVVNNMVCPIHPYTVRSNDLSVYIYAILILIGCFNIFGFSCIWDMSIIFDFLSIFKLPFTSAFIIIPVLDLYCPLDILLPLNVYFLGLPGFIIGKGSLARNQFAGIAFFLFRSLYYFFYLSILI